MCNNQFEHWLWNSYFGQMFQWRRKHYFVLTTVAQHLPKKILLRIHGVFKWKQSSFCPLVPTLSQMTSVSLPLPWKHLSEPALLCIPWVSVVSTLTYVNWVLYAWWIKKSTCEGAGCTGSQHTDSWRSWDPRALGTGPGVRKRGIEMAWIQQAGFDDLAFSSGLSVHPSRAQPGQPNPRLSPQRTVKEHVQLTTHWGPGMGDKSLGC